MGGPSHKTGTWKTNAITPTVPPSTPSFPQILLLSMVSYVMGYPFGHFGSFVQSVSSPSFLCFLRAYSLAWQYEKLKRPWFCLSTAQQHLKYHYVINTVFHYKYKTRLHTSYMKKISFTPAKPSMLTQTFPLSYLCLLYLIIPLRTTKMHLSQLFLHPPLGSCR